MTNNPLANALATAAYIAVVASFLFYVPRMFGHIEESVAIPVAFLSLFVFSAAMVGALLLFQPLALLCAGKGKESLTLFLQTIGLFALFAGALSGVLYLLV